MLYPGCHQQRCSSWYAGWLCSNKLQLYTTRQHQPYAAAHKLPRVSCTRPCLPHPSLPSHCSAALTQLQPSYQRMKAPNRHMVWVVMVTVPLKQFAVVHRLAHTHPHLYPTSPHTTRHMKHIHVTRCQHVHIHETHWQHVHATTLLTSARLHCTTRCTDLQLASPSTSQLLPPGSDTRSSSATHACVTGGHACTIAPHTEFRLGPPRHLISG